MKYVIEIYGRPDCGKCQTTKNKVCHFLSKWGLDQQVNVLFYDMSTVDGMGEGMLYDVTDIPTAMVSYDGMGVIREEKVDGIQFSARPQEYKGMTFRWNGVVPDSEQLMDAINMALRRYKLVANRWRGKKAVCGEAVFLKALLENLNMDKPTSEVVEKPELAEMKKVLGDALHSDGVDKPE